MRAVVEARDAEIAVLRAELTARQGRDRELPVLEELDHLAAHMQLRQVAMQVKPVQALQVQRNMTIQHVVDRDRHRPHDPDAMANLRTVAYARRMR